MSEYMQQIDTKKLIHSIELIMKFKEILRIEEKVLNEIRKKGMVGSYDDVEIYKKDKPLFNEPSRK